MWEPWALSIYGVKPWDMDGFTVEEWQELLDYEAQRQKTAQG